ncbi:MAG TPA: winged helix-turn-helix domain-containing protein [Blastocatellia bacterium]|nr:winged helix-turn-helix domain-containing protein [Blastocatellia bacterium]
MSARRIYHFGAYRLDAAERTLTRRGEPVPLTLKAFDTLLLLVERHGHTVRKEEILARVWPDSFVEEGVISVNIFTLRKCLAEDGTEFIQTVPKQGYRFVAPVDEDDAASLLRQQRPATPSASKAIAVLPFRWLNVDDADRYLGLGIADALITRLSNLTNLIVRPTSSVRKYEQDAADAVTIGQRLAVDAVLEGSIRRYGERLRVSVQLVSVRAGAPAWAEMFDEPLADLFAVEDSISERVADALTLKLTGEERSRLGHRHTRNAEAYSFYLKGRYFWNKRSEDGLSRGIEYFHKAIEMDSHYALAYAGLADSYLLGAKRQPPKEAMPRARAAALRAIEIDDRLGEAHTSLARIQMSFDWDWPGAEKAFQRALALNPNYATAHQWYANYLVATGRRREAIREIKRALELDPLSISINSAVGWVHYMAREFDDAITAYERALELEPTFLMAQREAAMVYAAKGDGAQAMAAVEMALAMSNGGWIEMGILAHTLAAAGRQQEALDVLFRLEPAVSEEYVLPQIIAATYLQLADKRKALGWLAAAYSHQSSSLMWLKADPWFDDLRREPEFLALLQRIGLASSQ